VVIKIQRQQTCPKKMWNALLKKLQIRTQLDYKESAFEGYTPHGIAVIQENTYINNNRTVAMKLVLTMLNGILGYAIKFMFDHTTVTF
jgi:transcriptional/translational regulatory protein YebC/TACO1